MNGRLQAGLVSCLVAAAAPLSGAAAGGSEPSGGVYVTTLPSGANVWIDGTYVGRAPILLDALVPGHHELTITKTGWAVQEVDVSVAGGTVVMSSTRLQAGTQALGGSGAGKVALHALPAGASLTLDGAPLKLSAGQAVSLPAGPHRIEMTTPHGRTVRAFTVLPDTTSELVLQETPSGDARSGVLAPAENYLPTNAFSVEGKKIVVRYAGHVVVAYFGESAVRYDGATADFDSMPQTIGGKLFLPLALLEKLTDDTSKDR